MKWDDPRVRVVKLAGASYRADALQDDAFAPGRRLALVREPENEHDPNAVAVWDAERRVQAGYVPAEIAPELGGDEQAVSLWEFRGEDGRRIGLRVLLAPADAGSRSRAREGLVLPRVRAGRDGRARRVGLVPGRRTPAGPGIRRRRAGTARRRRPRARTARSRFAARGPGRRSSCRSTRSCRATWGGRGRDGETFTWPLDGDWWQLGERRVRSAPFLGVIGMPPPEPGEHSTTPPRRWGGNIDCKELVAGTTLYLPIPVDGALLHGGRRPRRAGRRRGLGNRDRVPARAGDAHARRRRPRAPLADRPHRGLLARVRLRRGSRRGRGAGDRRRCST